jgi:glycosyltransferase involved in cell wall biosynthesis
MANDSFAVSQVLKLKVEEVLKLQKPLSVIGNALSDVYLEPADLTELKNEKDGFTIIAVGRLDENKNHRLLINAFVEAAIPGARLMLIGNGPLFDEYSKLIAEQGLQESVFLTGHLPKERVRAIMLASHLMVVSSIVETFSVVVIEAHACGLPVVSTNCGGPNELINNTNGILLSVNTQAEMANAIKRVYEKETMYNRKMIRINTIAEFGPEAIATKYSNAYEKVLQDY